MMLYIFLVQQAIHRPLPSSSICGFPFEFSCANRCFWLYVSKLVHTVSSGKLMQAGTRALMTSEITIIYFITFIAGFHLMTPLISYSGLCYYVTSTFSEGNVNKFWSDEC
jgi:hypothetical protein